MKWFSFDKEQCWVFCKRSFYLGKTKNIFFNASALSFNIFICIIPLSFLFFSLLGYLLTTAEATSLIDRFAQEFFPGFFYENDNRDWYQQLINPLISRRSVLGLIGFGVMIVTAQGLFSTAKHTLFYVFDINERRHPLMEMFYSFLTIGILGAVFLTFSLFFSALSLFFVDAITIPLIEYEIDIRFGYELIVQGLSIAFTFLLFLMVFRYLSEKKIIWYASFAGATAFTILFEISKLVFSSYLDYALVRYQYFYQGYTFVIVLGFWAFYSACIFVIAAIIARAFQDVYCPSDTNEEI